MISLHWKNHGSFPLFSFEQVLLALNILPFLTPYKFDKFVTKITRETQLDFMKFLQSLLDLNVFDLTEV